MVRGTEALAELLTPHQLLNGKWRATDAAALVGSLPQADGQGLLQTGHAKPHFQKEMAVWTDCRVRCKVTSYFVAADTEVGLASGELGHELPQAFRVGIQPTTYVSAALVPSIRKRVWPRGTQLKDEQLRPHTEPQPLQGRQASKSACIITFRVIKAGQAIQRRFGAVELDVEAEELTRFTNLFVRHEPLPSVLVTSKGPKGPHQAEGEAILPSPLGLAR
ncbi:hypothetical protein CSUB01_11467 [Colletotrichum sublineola]|uniref:Uncharacterized protein n=1 Tax=Colletotrichum sublineola TaxID=1173701 RepID=A0A066X659_COLSU|nr:hypothetical protein CSUB01_11467 [Colletotrichum sublineola]